jgi:glycine cleavage system aminomethyltransferase T
MSLHDELRAIRLGVALSDQPRLVALRYRGDAAWEHLDRLLPCDLGVHGGRLKQTLLLDDAGRPLADVLIGNLRGDLLVLALGMTAEALEAALAGGPAPDRLYETHGVLAVDGPFAWELMAAWNDPGIIGLPYLGVFSPSEGVIVLRAGRTGEYGYVLLVPRGELSATKEAIGAIGERFDARWIRDAAVAHCSLENWFFDPQQLGSAGLDALELQLGWRLDLQKEAQGMTAIREHRERGLSRRITAMSVAGPASTGADVTLDDAVIGSVIASVPGGEGSRGFAVLDMPFAHSGIDRYLVAGQSSRTLSPPFVLNRSLFVDPQKHEYARRAEIGLPQELRCDPLMSW